MNEQTEPTDDAEEIFEISIERCSQPLEEASLDPGVRRLVHWLNERGYRTTDSGDGITKLEIGFTAERHNISDHPYVAMVFSPSELIQEVDRLVVLLRDKFGVEVQRHGRCEPEDAPQIDAYYCPIDKEAVAVLQHVNDEMAFRNVDAKAEREAFIKALIAKARRAAFTPSSPPARPSVPSPAEGS